jgi:hypothetical protein
MVLEPTLRMKSQADSSSRNRNNFICREEKRKTAGWGMQRDPETCDPWVKVGIAFYSLFCVLPEGRDVFQMQMGISWGGEVSP